MRSFLGILAGFFTVPIISFSADRAYHAIHPAYISGAAITPGMALVILAYGAFSVFVGGYVTGMISRGHYVRNGLILGCLGLLIAIPVHIMVWHLGPAWYHVIDLLLVVPLCIWGAQIAGKRYQGKLATAA